MDWTPELLDEREEVALRSVAKALLEQMGQARYDEWFESFLLAHQEEILRGSHDNPARIRLEALLAKRDRSFE
jgi:hypothetical protein